MMGCPSCRSTLWQSACQPDWSRSVAPRVHGADSRGRRCMMAHLLLIDDDPALIPGQVRQAFPAPAHQVEVAGTGAAGLERVGTEPPDVVLLDLVLPDL